MCWLSIYGVGKMRKIIYVAAFLAIIAGIALFYVNSSSVRSLLPAYDGVQADAAALAELNGIANNATLAGSAIAVPKMVEPAAGKGVLALNGKPEILYIGADYCPFCATTRWALIIALMRFGAFSSLRYMTSSAADSYPSTPTFTFYGSDYSSSVISFVGVEMATNKFNQTINNYPVLQNLTGAEQALMLQNDPNGSIPFIDFANQSKVIGGAAYPSLIDGMDWQQIMLQLKSADSPVSQAIIGAANVYTAEICKVLNNSASVCSESYVSAIQKSQ